MSPRFSLRLLSGQSDERLLALARSGHERAFEALVQRYRRPLLRFCRRAMRLSDGRAEDVVQQSLLKAWMAIAAGTEVRDFKPWLYRIVRNTALNAMRGSAESSVAISDSLPACAHGDSELEWRLEVRDTLTHLAALPQGQREAILLTVIDGQSHEEVASALGVTHGAVRGLLHRARTTLRNAAAAITPPPLIAWAAGSAGSAGPSAERIAQVSSGAGALGASGLLAKGAVLAVTAGALATGAVVQLTHAPVHHTRSSTTTARAPVQTASARTGAIAAGAPTAANPAVPASAHGESAARSSGGGASHSQSAASAPSHNAAGQAGPRTTEPVSRGLSGTSPGSGSGSGAPIQSAPVASTATTPAEETASTQAQPQAPPPAEQPDNSEPTAPGGGGTDGGGATTSCETTEPAKSCDE